MFVYVYVFQGRGGGDDRAEKERCFKNSFVLNHPNWPQRNKPQANGPWNRYSQDLDSFCECQHLLTHSAAS